MRDGITHQGSKRNLLGMNPEAALVDSLSNETQVTPQTPPTLLIYAVDDAAVPIANSRLMYAALQKAGVKSAIQEYPHGGHGFGFGPSQYNISSGRYEPARTDNAWPSNSGPPGGWLYKAGRWLSAAGFMR